MKKILVLFLSLLILLSVLYFQTPKIVSHLLTERFKTEVVVKNIKFAKDRLTLERISIKNPKKSQIKDAFFAREVVIKSSLRSITSEIDFISFNDVKINVEMYDDSSSNNNWNKILGSHLSSNSDKKYLIKKLEINNISVTLTSPKNKTKNFPKIDSIKLTNVSSSSFDKIEQAIVHAIVEATFKEQQLDFLLSPMNLFKLPLFFW